MRRYSLNAKKLPQAWAVCFPWQLTKPAGWLVTVLPNFRKPLLAKGKEVTASRLAGMELQLDLERTADHSEAAVGEAIAGFQKEMRHIIGAWRVGHCGSPRRGARRH